MKTPLYITCSAALLLSACGGSDTQVVGIDELEARFNTFENLIGGSVGDISESDATQDANMPTQGASTYTGVAGVTLSNASDDVIFAAVGSANMTANFQSGSVTGSADNFFEIEDTRINGNLTYSFNSVAAGTNGLVGRITGSLSPSNLPAISINHGALGLFVGDNAEGFTAATDPDNGSIGVLLAATKD